ncbi:MAG TPA: GMC oxidoreductase [Acidimicrobiia bacterium]|nr:GMC oxidoreductase [Acidimicrobiia bacterium]
MSRFPVAELIDADARRGDTALQADVCVIGAGPAGRAICERLAISDIRVVLVDAGAVDDGDADGLDAESVGLRYAASEVSAHGWGGTARAWDDHGADGPGALMRAFEPTDLVPRPWIPQSGWPIGFDELAPYYDATDRFLGLEPVDDPWSESICQHLLPLPEDRIESVFYRYESARRYVEPPKGDGSGGMTVLHHAEVVDIEPRRPGGRASVRGRSAAHRADFNIDAKTVVLAGGTLQNTRLLLTLRAAGHVRASGDHIGRYFMEHPKGETGIFVPVSDEVVNVLTGYDEHQEGDVYCRRHLTLTPALRADEQLSGYYAALWPVEPDWLHDDLMYLAERVRRRHRGAPLFAVSFQVEQVPNHESRIFLSRSSSHRGPGVAVDWRLSEQDFRTLIRSQQIVQEELQLAGLGTVYTRAHRDRSGGLDVAMWRGDPSHLKTSHHPTGTTRMADDPRDGVVDRDCRVFDLSSLYVAGSSVFPTGSHINPTYTIVALAQRLADHLLERH